MGETTISWTDRVWNPVTGCSPVNPACDNCYAKRMAPRLRGRFGYPQDEPFAVTLHPDRLSEPLELKKPQRIFVCSMGDLFHPEVPYLYALRVFTVMAMAPQHTFQVLTKRPGRMAHFANKLLPEYSCGTIPWPSNVWAGVSIPNARYLPWLDVLARVPAPVRFVSLEPLLSGVDIRRWLGYNPSHEVEELRRYCLQCGYQWRTDDRPVWPYLEDSVEAGRQVAQMYSGVSSDTATGRASPSFGVPPNPFNDELEADQCPGAPSGVQALLRPDSRGNAAQPQERDQGRQPAGEPGGGDPLSERATYAGCSPQGQGEIRSAGRGERNGQTDRCPSCGDTLPTWRRGTTYLNSFGLWCRFPNDLQDSTRSAPIIHWTICGGESGPKARPSHPDWFRSVRNQCEAAAIPYFFKQWGEWKEAGRFASDRELESGKVQIFDDGVCMRRAGRRAAGAMLDGREWKEFPNVQ